MPFNPSAHQSAMFAHLLAFAQKPAWADYITAEVQTMAEQCPGLYANFPAKLNQELRRIATARAKQGSAAALKTDPPNPDLTNHNPF